MTDKWSKRRSFAFLIGSSALLWWAIIFAASMAVSYAGLLWPAVEYRMTASDASVSHND